MAHDGVVSAFRDVAASATVERTAAQKGSASVSQVAPGLPPSSEWEEKSEDADLLLRFFDLKRNPFSDTPEEGFFCSNAAVRQVYRELITALRERSGGAVLTGEPGAGKTTLLRRLRGELKAAGHFVIARYRAGLFFNDLVTVIAEEIQVPSGNDNELGFPTRLRKQLERNKYAQPPVLIIDDAERLGGDVIRNLERLFVGPADRSLRVLLCGRPELAKRLELPVLAELRRMLLVSYRLERLDDDDAASYIFHRLRAAGYRGSDLFLSSAINTVVAKAGGLPRQINRLCTKSLTLAAATGNRFVTSEIVEQAVGELSPKDASPVEARHESRPSPRDRAAIVASTAAGIIAAGTVIYSLGVREPALEVRRTAAEQRLPVVVAALRAPNEIEAGHNSDPAGSAVAAPSEPVLSSPALAGTGASVVMELSAPPEASTTENPEQPNPEQALSEKAAVGGEPGTFASLQPDDDMAELPGTGAPGEASATPEASTTENPERPKPVQVLSEKAAVEPSSSASLQPDDDMPKLPGTAAPREAQTVAVSEPAGAIPEASDDGSAAPVVAGNEKGTQAEGAEKSESATPPETTSRSSGAPNAVPAVTLPAISPMPAGSIAALINRGNELFSIGDISAARLAYERAASGGSAAAMTALGMTYDPSVLGRVSTGGIRPDPAIAAEWYRRAAALGNTEAAARIQRLPATASRGR
jgi:type II secretory pathway predicted ATPase ExeA